MGKTKTAFVSDIKAADEKKSSAEAYKEKKEKQKAKKEEQEKLHISGLKGGQRVKIVSGGEPLSQSENTSEEKAKDDKKEIKAKERGKNYKSAKSKIEPGKTYKVADAIKLVKDTSYSKFDGTMELHLVVKKTGTNASVVLPFSAGRAKKVEVATDETIKRLTSGKIDFDILLATADMMPKLVPFARLLGPRGLMPNPKNGTIIKKASDADKFSGNTVNLKTEKDAPLIHTVVGKVSQKDSELKDNIEAIFKALGAEKQIVRVFLKSTMSPSVKISIS